MNSEIRFDRLEQIADHLERGQLAHEQFDFGHYNINEVGYIDGNVCGTMGCAIGEFPAIWPDQFRWWGNGVTEGGLCNFAAAENWLGINFDQSSHLFMPHDQMPNEFGGVRLGCDATKEQVASNIRAFIEKMKSND